jgi:HEAT repeat protein
MNCEECRSRIPDLWEGVLDDQERATIEMHLASCIQCRSENEHLNSIWRGLGQIPSQEPGPVLRARFYEKLEAYQQGYLESGLATPRFPFFRSFRLWWSARPALQFAVSLATLLIGFWAGFSLQRGREDSQLGQLHSEVASMRQMVALSLMQQQSASDRLKGVNWAYRVEQPDTEVLSALLYTVNHDSSVNVRLAAVDALRTFSNSPVAVRGLTQAIGKQNSPMVQIALIDQLADMRDRGAVPALQTLVGDGQVNSEVRQRAEWALGRLR